MEDRSRGSITIFAALSLMLVAQLIFTLLESARNAEYYRLLQMNTDTVLESVFADYVSPLWDNYRLLGFRAENRDGMFSFNNREAELRSLSGANLGSRAKETLWGGSSLITAEMTDAEFFSYLLMTDRGGKVYQAAVVSYMKNNLLYETAQSVFNSYESVKEIKDNYGGGDATIGDALRALESLKEESGDADNVMSAETERRGNGGVPSGLKGASADMGADGEENLLTAVVEAKKRGILSLVLPKEAIVSGAGMDLELAVSHRTLEEGTGSRELSDSWYDRVLMNQYLVHYLTAYTDGVTDRGLNYELEYLIGGKNEDSKNLKTAVTEILAIREALNFASIVASPEKQEAALALAMLLAGITVNPLIIEAVKYGILAAWAFVESILDLRALLAGEKVVMMKNDLSWTSDLDAVPALLSGFVKAKSSPQGKSYRDYLSLLLFFHGGETLAMRAMDVQEATIRQLRGYENFRMDCVVCETGVRGTYSYVPVFAGFVTMTKHRQERIRIQRSSSYSYLERLTL